MLNVLLNVGKCLPHNNVNAGKFAGSEPWSVVNAGLECAVKTRTPICV